MCVPVSVCEYVGVLRGTIAVLQASASEIDGEKSRNWNCGNGNDKAMPSFYLFIVFVCAAALVLLVAFSCYIV